MTKLSVYNKEYFPLVHKGKLSSQTNTSYNAICMYNYWMCVYLFTVNVVGLSSLSPLLPHHGVLHSFLFFLPESRSRSPLLFRSSGSCLDQWFLKFKLTFWGGVFHYFCQHGLRRFGIESGKKYAHRRFHKNKKMYPWAQFAVSWNGRSLVQ